MCFAIKADWVTNGNQLLIVFQYNSTRPKKVQPNIFPNSKKQYKFGPGNKHLFNIDTCQVVRFKNDRYFQLDLDLKLAQLANTGLS